MTQLTHALMQQIYSQNPYEGFDYQSYAVDMRNCEPEKALFKQIIEAFSPRLVIEVGSFKGDSAIAMASTMREQGTDGTVICVDTWLGGEDHMRLPPDHEWNIDRYRKHGYCTLYYQFLANVMHAGLQDYILPIPNTSVIVARYLNNGGLRADLIYIDGSHEEDDVYQDVSLYWKVLKAGGVMVGDDWAANWPGVICAVNRFARENDLQVTVTGQRWMFGKPASNERSR